MDGRALVLAEVALCGVTVTLALTLARLFESPSFLPKLVAVAVAAHLVAAVVRRLRLRLWIAIPLVVLAGVLIITWLYLPGSTTLGIPTGRTLDLARSQLTGAFSPFRKLIAPVPITAGFELTMAAGLWVLAVFSDAAAFGGEAPVQALVPHATVFVGSAVFARHRSDVLAGAAVTVAAMVFLAAHRAARSSRRHWIQSEERRGSGWLLGMGTALAVTGVVAAAFVAPRLPGAGTDALVDLRSIGRGPGPVEVGNPLVGVGNLLGQQSDEVLFTARSATPHYWRLTALEDYDPTTQQWRTHRSYREADSGDRLPRSSSGPTTREPVHVELSGMPGIWLPSPFEPGEVTAGVDLRYDPDSSSVIAGGRTSLPDISYDVVADVPELTPPADGSSVRPPVDPVYLRNPQVSQLVIDTLQAATDGIEGAMPRLQALQNWFRDHFTYDQDVDYSASADPTAAFLSRQRGFCQQFASTFAVMARLMGIPSRVAVGFTYGTKSGEPDRDGRTEWVVRGRQAHAWPEVWLAGAGWVPFEPTPGRGNPDASQLTGVPAAQDDQEVATASTTTTVAPSNGIVPTTVPVNGQVDLSDQLRNKPATPARGSSVAPWVLLGLVLAVVAAVAGRAAFVQLRRRRRRGHSTSPPGRVRAAWLEACDWLELARIHRRPNETPAEFSSRAGRLAHFGDLDQLAEMETLRLFGDRPIEPVEADAAELVAKEVRATVLTQTDRRQRVEHALGWNRRN
jgi:transglutaminase-like putative cysteine protease